MKRITIMMICMLLLASLLGGCAGTETPVDETTEVPETTAVYQNSLGKDLVIHPEPSGRMDFIMTDIIEFSFEESVNYSSHIVDAEFLGFYYGVLDELVFRVNNIYKGNFDDPNEIIYVHKLESTYRLEPGEEEIYKIGKEYMLFLNLNASPYYHDLYAQCGQLYMPEWDKDWDKTHTDTKKVLSSAANSSKNDAEDGEQYTVPYTDSAEVNMLLEQSDSVFVVEPESIFSVPDGDITTVYRCKVKMVITGTPNNNGSILIPFFNDTVEIGEKYVVMLNSTGEESEVYALSGINGVFSFQEAQYHSVLGPLMQQQAVIYVPAETAD